jgi:pyrroloquinoline quinone biosynthesis protein B
VSADGEKWFLVGASPDLRMQIEATPALFPKHGTRESPVAGVVLLSAELDHVLGLLSLRERHPLRVYSTNAVWQLVQDNAFFRMLKRQKGQCEWTELEPGHNTELQSPSGEKGGLAVLPISVGQQFPFYAGAERRIVLNPAEAVIGLLIESPGGRRIFYAPGLPRLSAEFLDLFGTCDLLLLDGTFWSDDELLRATGQGAAAHEMGHLPVGGSGGLIAQLAQVRGPRKVLMHINNTNPILDGDSAEYREVMAAGWEVAEDGWECEL